MDFMAQLPLRLPNKAMTKFSTATYGTVLEQTKLNMTVAEKRKITGLKMHTSGIRVLANNLIAKS